MKRLVKWESWIDPLNSNLDEVEWPGFNLDEDGDEIPVLQGAQPLKVIQTPMGFVSALDTSFASSNFDFWIMHTNFDLTPEIINIIKTVNGVETLEVYTRYRARIGFPKSGFFKSSDVMSKIQNSIDDFYMNQQLESLESFPNEIQQKVYETVENLKNRDFWTILVLPNGNIDLVTSDKDDRNYQEKIKNLFHINETIGGQIIQSE